MVNRVKILHCADLHLGAEPTGTLSGAVERRQELLGTFRKITKICKNEAIDLLLIAGDMFEGSNIDETTLQSVKEYLGAMRDNGDTDGAMRDNGDTDGAMHNNVDTDGAMRGTIVAIAPGNHDYASIDSPFAKNNWPENVIIFRSKLEKVDFRDRGFAIYGAAFTGTYQYEPLLQLAERPDPALINICVLHGDFGSSGVDSNYNLVTEAQIASSGFDYLALGHIHKRTEILRAGDCSYAYPGCPDGRGFDELGPKGVYIGTIGKSRAELSFRPVCSRMYLDEPIDISGLEAESEIVKQCLKELKKRYGEDYFRHLYKLTLTGSITAGFSLPLGSIRDVLKETLYFVKLRDHTHVEIDYEALAKESSLRGIFVRKMLERINAADGATTASTAIDVAPFATTTPATVSTATTAASTAAIAVNDYTSEAAKLRRALEIGIMSFEGEVKLDDY